MRTLPSLRTILRGAGIRRATLMALLAAIFVSIGATPLHAAQGPFGVDGAWDWVNLMNGMLYYYPLGSAASVPEDSLGWPESDAGIFLFDNRKNMPYSGPDQLGIDEDLAGTYNISFIGQATIQALTESPTGAGATIENQVYNSSTNTTTAQIVYGPGYSAMFLQLSNTQRQPGDQPGDGFTNLQIIRPGYSLGTTQVFTTNSIDSYTNSSYAQVRFAGPDDMNSYGPFCSPFPAACVTTWAERVLPTQAYQGGTGLAQNNTSGQSNGVAWEYMIEFANATNTNMWINIPVSADDEYVTSLASLILNGDTVNGVTYPGLNSNLIVYVEYSNEVWNNFPQYTWNANEASANGVSIDQQYINQSIHFAKLFESVMGGAGNPRASRVHPVIAWQPRQQMTIFNDLITWDNQNDDFAGSYLYGVGDAPYISPYDTSTVASTFASTYSYLSNGNSGAYSTADATRRETIAWTAVANYFYMNVIGYESGPTDLSSANMAYVMRNPQISSTLSSYYYNDWFGVGGDEINYFSLQSNINPYGNYMIIEDYDHGYPGPQGTTVVRQNLWWILAGGIPPQSAGYLLPYTTGQTVTVDPSQDIQQAFGGDAAPNSGMNLAPYTTYLYLLRSPSNSSQTAYYYTLSLTGYAESGAGPVLVYVNNAYAGSIQMPSTLGQSPTVSFRVFNGYYTLYLIPTGGSDYFPPTTGSINLSLNSGSPSASTPSAPANITATPGNGSISLTWATTTTATSYYVFRSAVEGGPYTDLGNVTTNSYTDSTAVNGELNYYVIEASNSQGTSSISPEVSAYPATAIPSTPTGLTITAGADDQGGQAIVSWSAVPNAQGYNVYQSTNGGGQSLVSSVQSGTQYTALGLSSGNSYSYTVSAANYLGTSSQSSPATTEITEQIRQTPTNLTCQNISGFSYLQWTPDPVTTPQFNYSFNLQRSTTSGGPYSTVVGINTNNAYDFSAVPGTTYYYVVAATNQAGQSGNSNQVSCASSTDGANGYGSGSNNIPQYP